ncbi:MAG: hypothetical protein HC836_28145 [Richelia sp. RM2_1_2]|nr:hypothetical protein [Richelia sp. RM2_1_2]
MSEQHKPVSDALNEYYAKKKNSGNVHNEVSLTQKELPTDYSNVTTQELHNVTNHTKQLPSMPKFGSTQDDFMNKMSREADPDLTVGLDIIKLPSGGRYYKNGLAEVAVEYLTSKDEDILTTPALIENGTVLDIILRRKIKTPNVNVDDLLVGDKDAILIFLRASSYGKDYDVTVTDPITGKQFKSSIDLTKLKNKEVTEEPDQLGEFSVQLPMRKKLAKFRLLSSKEIDDVIKKAEAIKEAYNTEYNEVNTLRIKTQVTEIDGNRDKGYIGRFIDAMPALDSLTLRKKMLSVSPGIDMSYQFTSPAGNTFKAPIIMGIDFFFPSL